MNVEKLIKILNDMILLYGNRIILTITDGESEFRIKDVCGNQCAKYFEPIDKVSEIIIEISKIQK